MTSTACILSAATTTTCTCTRAESKLSAVRDSAESQKIVTTYLS